MKFQLLHIFKESYKNIYLSLHTFIRYNIYKYEYINHK